MSRGPTTSPAEPARRRRDPEVRALTEDGYNSRLGGMDNDLEIRGSKDVRRPVVKEAIRMSRISAVRIVWEK